MENEVRCWFCVGYDLGMATFILDKNYDLLEAQEGEKLNTGRITLKFVAYCLFKGTSVPRASDEECITLRRHKFHVK